MHSPPSAEAPLPRARIQEYAERGFLMLEDLFSAEELEALRAESARLRHPQRGADDSVIAELGDKDIRSVFRVHEVSPLFRRLAQDARLVRVAEYVLGDRVYIHQSRLNYKPGFFGKEFYWHSDFETWHVEDGMPAMRAFSVSISLSENTPNNGPLMLIPGSHQKYISCVGETPEDHFRQSLRKQEYGVPDPEILSRLVDEGGIEAAVGPVGTTVLFDCNTMHGSNGNITPHPRSNVFIVYNSINNIVDAPYGPAKPRPDFLAERDKFEPIAAADGPIRH